jgi:hypothetical protein
MGELPAALVINTAQKFSGRLVVILSPSSGSSLQCGDNGIKLLGVHLVDFVELEEVPGIRGAHLNANLAIIWPDIWPHLKVAV